MWHQQKLTLRYCRFYVVFVFCVSLLLSIQFAACNIMHPVAFWVNAVVAENKRPQLLRIFSGIPENLQLIY